MLQIITGRFFKSDRLYRTEQQTVLYSNFRPVAPLETVVGAYVPTASAHEVGCAVYKVEQRLEAVRPDGSPEVLTAVPPEDIAKDFTAVLSFLLRVTCSMDLDLVRRLTQSVRTPIGTNVAPARLVDQVFDREVRTPQVDTSAFSDFLADLVRLERVRFKGVMRAIRRYVVALNRIGDDLPMAYALLVASIESLAQQFDDFEPTWQDLDDAKRRKVDGALVGSSKKVRDAVRDAILEIEHVALGRRFKEFALAHLPASYFREEAIGRSGSARKSDLPQALTRAYTFRSQLVHRLKELPRLLVHAGGNCDVINVDGKPTLTFRGLVWLARRVILHYVEQSPKIDSEDFDYRSELPNVITAPLSPRYWIGRRENYHSRSARHFLTGFLNQLESALMGGDKDLTDMRGVLEEIEQRVPRLSAANRLPMLALYVLYHRHIGKEWRRPDAEAFWDAYAAALDKPSIESLVCHVVLEWPMYWPSDHIKVTRQDYLDQRYHKNGLLLPPVLETALAITVANALLTDGKQVAACQMLREAVEGLPGHDGLCSWEARWEVGDYEPIDWRKLLLPERDRGSSEQVDQG